MRLLLIFLALLFTHMLTAQPIKVMTYNIRYDNPGDGLNAWPKRINKVVSLIQKYDPEIIGVQEALHHQLQELIRVLPEYSFVGVGRDDGATKGEYSAILYKHSRFGLLSNHTFWLSETVDVPASKSWDAAITRVATWARFFDKDAKTDFFFLNTHFDHIGKQARMNSSILIKSRLFELSQGRPILVSGDFNCPPEEEAYQELIRETEPTLFDANRGRPTGTYCGFEVGVIACTPIDYIFHSSEWQVNRFHIIADNDGKYYPSDHLPVLTEVELTPKK